MVRVRVAAFALLSLAYPLVVYLSLGRFEPRWLSLLLFGMAALRALTTRQPVWWVAALGTGLLALIGRACVDVREDAANDLGIVGDRRLCRCAHM